tara:strand:- start:9 stop:200 length:192 start_codon:yes stop_codon:yes gene_type:complete
MKDAIVTYDKEIDNRIENNLCPICMVNLIQGNCVMCNKNWKKTIELDHKTRNTKNINNDKKNN